MPGRRIVILDGARKLGAKILVAGGGRCNVTNRAVTARDFWGGSANVIRRVLGALPVPETVAFFRELGVELHEEENGKLFPDSNSARTVLAALLGEAERRGVQIRTLHRVTDVRRRAAGEADAQESNAGGADTEERDGFEVETTAGVVAARRVVLATGGRSLPKTGSDGFGYELARRLGHTLVPQTPGLAPLVLDGRFHEPLTGVSQPAELTLAVAGEKPRRFTGMLLWTHVGVSGPVVLDVSRHWHRARLERRAVAISASFLPGESAARVAERLIALGRAQPRTQLHTALARLLPNRVAAALLGAIGVPGHVTLAWLSREQRARVIEALVAWPLFVRDSRGYTYAEVTAGGVPLREVDPGTLASRVCPGLSLVGEILDVDGRLGGFNFQWAWSSGFVAAGGIARSLMAERAGRDTARTVESAPSGASIGQGASGGEGRALRG